MAYEIRALVALGSTGNYAVVVNPANGGQAFDTGTQGWVTYNRTTAAQKIALGNAIAAGASDAWQMANLPTGLTAKAFTFDVYTSGGEYLCSGAYEIGPSELVTLFWDAVFQGVAAWKILILAANNILKRTGNDGVVGPHTETLRGLDDADDLAEVETDEYGNVTSLTVDP